MHKTISLSLLLVLIFACQTVMGQGLLMPEHHDDRFHMPRHWHPHRRVRPQPVISWKIKSIEINSKIEDQVAITQVSQTFVNTGQRQLEASFVFPLPYDGAVDSMTFLVDGKEYEAKLLPADKAREVYEGYMRRNQDPALLEWMGQGMFKTSVFPIPAGAERTVQISYTQLLRQDGGVNDLLIPMSTAKYTDTPIESFKLRATINTKEKLKSVYSPTSEIQVDRSGDNLAVVKLERESFIPASDVRVMFTTDNAAVGANLMSYRPAPDDNGYFTLLVTPDIKAAEGEPARKTVIFVVDRSGSMNGKKIEQAREAAKFVLNNLREDDLFNIVTYASDVETFEPELQSFDTESRASALGFIEGIFAGGSTNIDGALTKTLVMIGDDAGPTYVVFLTDGLPTAGETNEAKIAARARQNNKQDARIISFGVGYDVNSRLLDRITRENNGQSQYVQPDEDLEEHVSRLYSKISAPVLTDVTIDYLMGSEERLVNRVYPADEFDLFAGQQLVLVGRYKTGGEAKLKITGKVGDETQSFEYEVTFASASDDNRYSFAARLWAVRRIGEIIDVIDLEGKNQELIDELIRLSVEHGIVTPYTSYLADDLAPASDLADLGRQRMMAGESLDMLDAASGQMEFQLRRNKQQFRVADNAPTPFSAGGGGGGYGGGVPRYSQGGAGRGGQSGGGGRQRRDAGLGQGVANRGQVQLGGGPGQMADGDSEGRSIEEVVRMAGKDTAYLRGTLLVASNAADVDLEKDKDQITEIERFSTEYFDLLQTTTKQENMLLALQQEGEEMLVRLQGKIYRLK
ncbi:MAG: VIT domain-containing protein [Pirellulaceae bacterium]